MTELIDAYGLDVVQAYMYHIQKNAEFAVRDMLKNIGISHNKSNSKSKMLNCVDYLDDGSAINLSVEIDVENGEAVFDFQ